ncbi:NAD-dependent epimerase/dehydratase family protein [Roseomonas chloroacetimidivorans]|uniref:NAD-dependent epimerase/dehydratase family protein n=1 Tax=Roseomonas chloroacetimidivorans TaxID=1766656 RepID=UPI003C7594F4
MAQKDVVLLTGGSGFIGGALIPRLAGAGFHVVALDRAGPPHPPPPAEAVDADLTSDESIAAALQRVRERHGGRIAAVVHLAAYYDLSGEPSPLYNKVTVQGTARLLRGLRDLDLEVEQFVFSSTMLVHAPTEPGRPITEDAPLDPRWAYPESKVRTEALLRAEHGTIPVVLLRIAGVYDDRCHNAFLAQQIARIYEHQLVSRVFPGESEHGQAFLHLDDLAEAVLRVVQRRRDLPPELPLLVGEPETLGYNDVQRIVGETLHDEPWPTAEVPKPLAKAGAWVQTEVLGEEGFIRPWMIDYADDHYEINVGRARALLGWSPRRRLREALPGMVRALRADPTGWYRENRLDPAVVAQVPARRDQAATQSEAAPTEDTASVHAAMGHASVPDHAATGHASMDHAAMGHGTMEDHGGTMDVERRQTRWAHFTNIALGAWLLSSPLVFGIEQADEVPAAVARITAERGLPSIEWRSAALAWSDGISGLLIMLFAALSLSARFAWAQWANTAVGIWLLFAPLLFWAPSAAIYANDTLVGSLVIAFAVLVPMMPGMSMAGMMDPAGIPPGWTYSPSTWAQRTPVLAMGLLGFVISRYLTAYQLGHVEAVWDPFFSGEEGLNGTETIITSDVSKAWPIPDGGLGAIAYVLEILMAAMGDNKRWRTMPWMVTFFGILVVPLGVVSIYFVIIQPIVIGTWCSLCLLAALAMLLMIPFALDELVAMGQFLRWSHCTGRPLLRTFLMGDAMKGGRADDADDLATPGTAWRDLVRGVTLPWTLAASALVGLWLMFTRAILGNAGAMANSDHVVGALAITVVIIATAEVARPLRFVNVLFGAWLLVTPWLLEGVASPAAAWASVAAGVLLIGLSLPRGPRTDEHYAGWDRYVV